MPTWRKESFSKIWCNSEGWWGKISIFSRLLCKCGLNSKPNYVNSASKPSIISKWLCTLLLLLWIQVLFTITSRLLINWACESPACGTAVGLCTPNARLRGFLHVASDATRVEIWLWILLWYENSLNVQLTHGLKWTPILSSQLRLYWATTWICQTIRETIYH